MSERVFSAGEIFAKLERHGVDYVAIGGIAANAHGSRRLTLDVDIIPEPATPNYERLAAALDDLDLAARGLNVLNGVPGAAPYDDLRKRAVEVDVRGTRIRIASLDDLIAMKRASGRPRDLGDIADLTAEPGE
jgi:predicted nucleotidyltransferase